MITVSGCIEKVTDIKSQQDGSRRDFHWRTFVRVLKGRVLHMAPPGSWVDGPECDQGSLPSKWHSCAVSRQLQMHS